MFKVLYEKLVPSAMDPVKPTDVTCSGFDIHANNIKKVFTKDGPKENVQFPLVLQPMERALVGTGLAMSYVTDQQVCNMSDHDMEATSNHLVGEIQIRPRSGNAYKFGLTVLNTPGTIDNTYEGEVGVILINLGFDPVTINQFDAIAQAVPSEIMVGVKLLTEGAVVGRLSDNARGSNGFGSSGVVGK